MQNLPFQSLWLLWKGKLEYVYALALDTMGASGIFWPVSTVQFCWLVFWETLGTVSKTGRQHTHFRKGWKLQWEKYTDVWSHKLDPEVLL